ncbi:MAG TPA: hypothetical protein VNV85_17280 [Puia sp.]|jgi:hypothetical protein|nr:hypothetical protein [Puia sp.]
MKNADNIDYLPSYAFWDVNRENLDFSRDKSFIISRLFERGKLDDVLSVTIMYGKDEIGVVLRNNKYLSRQGLFLAHALLGLPLQDFKAYAAFKHH